MGQILDFNGYKALTFDCYGTLIDWESGILGALRPLLEALRKDVSDEQLLQLYAKAEASAEQGEYVPYKEVLRRVMRHLGDVLGFVPSPSQLDCLVVSLKDWPPFPDTVAALQSLKSRFKLAIISNVDDDLFSLSATRLKVPFDWVITAEQARSYKPSLNNFRFAIERMGIPPGAILHVAQSLYHDIAPARALGLPTVWVNRRKGRKGSGATPPASARPDLEVPDLKALVSMMGLASR